MLSELPFGAFLSYSPRGRSDLSRKSRAFVMDLKQDRVVSGTDTASAYLVRRLKEELPGTALASFLDPAAVLVPVPRSALLLPNALWPSLNLAREMVKRGSGARVLPCLERTEAVTKSAFARSGQRPTPQKHYETLRHLDSIGEPDLLCLVDDVVTKGSTLIGAASRLQEHYPGAVVRAFAAVRTRGLQPEIDQIVEPCVGRIWLIDGEAYREP